MGRPSLIPNLRSNIRPRSFPSVALAVLTAGLLLLCCPLPARAQAVNSAVTGGSWSNSAIWSAGHQPVAGEAVVIPASTVVSLDVASDAALDSVTIQGTLRFRTDISTRLTAVTVSVASGGLLEVGTQAAPVSAGVSAEVVIADQALNTSADPLQLSHGLVSSGSVVMHGAVRAPTFLRLETEAHAGDRTVRVASAVSGWAAGDTLLLPDTRQLRWNEHDQNYVPQFELQTLSAVSPDGRTLTLAQPLRFDHIGARDGSGHLDFSPHIGDLERNVRVRSANGAGVRGHVRFTGRGTVDIRYVAFRELSRTTLDQFNDATTTNGVLHAGTNQSGRYAVHFEHFIGPSTVPADGYQFTFVGNAVSSQTLQHRFRWGIVVNDSHYGLIKDNIVYNMAGTGIVLPNGNESFNVVDHNFVVAISGTGNRFDSGRDGLGYFFRGPNNSVRNNVASTINPWSGPYDYGFGFDFQYLGNIHVPKNPGADTDVAGQFTVSDGNLMTLREFANNELYGATNNGLFYNWVGSGLGGRLPHGGVIQTLIVWHNHWLGIFHYPSAPMTIDGMIARGRYPDPETGTTAFNGGDYDAPGLVLQNCDFQGMGTGFNPSTVASEGVQTIRDSYIRSVTGVYSPQLATSSYRSDWIPARIVVIRNVRFDPYPGTASYSIYRVSNLDPWRWAAMNLIQLDQFLVYDYNGNPSDDFEVYYPEQVKSYVLPQSTWNSDGTTGRTASPEAGLTMQQNWNKYGIALAGKVAPDNAGSRAGVGGLVVPIQDTGGSDAAAPTVAIVSPADGSTVEGSIVVHVSASDDVGVTQVTLSIDGTALGVDQAAPYDFTWDSTAIANGSHSLRATAFDASGKQTTIASSVTVNNPPGGGSGGGSGGGGAPSPVSSIKVKKSGKTGCKITWKTSIPTHDSLSFGIGGPTGIASAKNSKHNKQHQVTLKRLQPGSTYTLDIISTTPAGVMSATSPFSYTVPSPHVSHHSSETLR